MSSRTHKIIAVIPARAGSKRLKNKNVLSLYGKPMLAHTIEAALRSEIFEDVLVSTDEEKIARIARRYGASVPFLRDERLADDHTPVSEATLSAVEQMQAHTGKTYTAVVQLMPNCPCRDAKDIRDAYKQFSLSRSKFQISVFPFGWMNPWWAMRLDGQGRPQRLFPKAYTKRSQDLDKLYCPTGAVWIANMDALRQQKTFYGKGFSVFIMDWRHALDIDDQEDLQMAKIVLELSGKRRG